MNKLVFGHDSEVAEWVARNIPSLAGQKFEKFSAIGVVDANDEALAGVVYHDYRPKFRTLEISMAAVSPRWASRGIIRALLSYPFLQIGVNKVWTASEHTNARAIKFLKGIGMTQEGVMRHQFGPKNHAVIHGLTRVEFDRLFLRNENGQRIIVAPARA